MKPAVLGVVVLTMGARPADLAKALDSLGQQRDVELDVVVVGNGWTPTHLPAGVRGLALAENVGIPAGRNAGASHVSGDLLFFLDDDAALRDDDTLASIAQRFADHPRLGLLQPRVVDPSGRPAPRRWVPRLRVGDPARPGFAMNVWEGAVAIRRSCLEAAGGWPDTFFYGHEGIDLAWRVWDSGATVWYAGDIVVNHPVISPTRHAMYFRLNARNRVWLALRNLPGPVVPVYLSTWVVITLVRVRSPRDLRTWFGGFREGFSGGYGERRPMKWRTVARMALAGRPPVV